MLRRHLIALGGRAIAGATVAKLGQLLAELPGPPPVPLPTQLSHVHVTQVRDLTRRVGLGDTYCDPEVCSSAAALATRLWGWEFGLVAAALSGLVLTGAYNGFAEGRYPDLISAFFLLTMTVAALVTLYEAPSWRSGAPMRSFPRFTAMRPRTRTG